MIKKKRGSPLYQQVRDIIKKKIETGEYKPQTQIPSIVELTSFFSVSTITIRQALADLMRNGYLETKAGGGTFVTADWAEKQQKKSNKIIGVIFTDFFKNPFFSQILEGIESVMSINGYHIIVNNNDNNSEKEARLIREIKEKGVDGFILCPASSNRSSISDQILKELLEEKFPLVFVDRKIEEFPFDYVTTNNFEGGYIATKYLLGLGHTKIGLILGVEANTVRERLQGYQKALKEAGIDFDPLMIKKSYIELTYKEAGYQNTMELLHLKNPPTAIFACNDPLAMGSYKACQELGLNIPEDLSIIGYDDIPEFSHLNPPITTIHQPIKEMGEQAAKLLLERIEDRNKPAKKVILKNTLIVRNSCRQYSLQTDKKIKVPV